MFGGIRGRWTLRITYETAESDGDGDWRVGERCKPMAITMTTTAMMMVTVMMMMLMWW